jgi:hypothetical protein
MFKIIKQEEPLLASSVNILIYGEAGVGKTSLAFTARNPILLDFDDGSYRSGYRKDCLTIGEFTDIKSNLKEFVENLKNYDTIIIDTVGSMQDSIKNYLLQTDPSLASKRKSFDLWSAMLNETMDFFKLIKGQKRNMILIAHVQEKVKGDDIIKRPVIAGQSKDQIYRYMDYIGYMYFRNSKRELTFSPKDDSTEGKNTSNYPDILISNSMPNNFFEIEISKMLDNVNLQNANNHLALKEIHKYKDEFSKLETAEQFNETIPLLKQTMNKNIIWELLKERAKEVNLNYDIKEKVFK